MGRILVVWFHIGSMFASVLIFCLPLLDRQETVTKVFIVEDHAIVREGLKLILSNRKGISVCGEAADGVTAIRKLLEDQCDVALLDITMPGKNGLEVLKQVKKEKPDLPILILSMHSEEQYAMRALRAGAAGYLTKESAPEKLIEAIIKVASGGKYISPSLAEKLAHTLDPQSQGKPHERLSDREDQVFRQLINGRTVSQIARHFSLSVKTISTHRSHILSKMHMKTNAELMHYAAINGLLTSSHEV